MSTKPKITTEEEPVLFNMEDICVDVAAIEEGRWVPLGAEFPGVEIEVRGLSSKPARKLQQQLERAAPRTKRLTNGQLTPEATDEILTTVLVEKCVRDWKGIGEHGKLIEFDKDKLKMFLSVPKYRRFKAAVINAITDLETRKEAAEEGLVKN